MNTLKTNTSTTRLLSLSILGSILLIVGPLVPWFTFLGGLQTFPGVAGLNGKILFVSGIATFLLSIVYLIKHARIIPWILRGVGTLQLAFSCYLLFTLYKTYHQLLSGGMNSMMDAGIGPGLFITTIGALLLFSLVFFPIEKREYLSKATQKKRLELIS